MDRIAYEILIAKQQAREGRERQNKLKQQLQDEYDKENLECLVCKKHTQRKCMEEHQKTVTCKKKGILLEGTQKEHYYDKNHIEETHNKYYESAKCQYCPTNTKNT